MCVLFWPIRLRIQMPELAVTLGDVSDGRGLSGPAPPPAQKGFPECARPLSGTCCPVTAPQVGLAGPPLLSALCSSAAPGSCSRAEPGPGGLDRHQQLMPGARALPAGGAQRPPRQVV